MTNDGHLTLQEVYDSFGQLLTSKELFYDWIGLNKWLFLCINHIRADYYDQLMVWLTQLGNRHHFPYIMGTLVIFAVISIGFKKLKKQGGAKQYASRWLGVLLVLTLGIFVNAVVIGGAKNYFAYPRPYAALASALPATTEKPDEKVYVLEQRPAEDAYHSFPSGHVAFITLMVVGLWPLLVKNMRYFGGFLIGAVAWSRMSLGVHFPADVLGGFLLAALSIIALRFLLYKLLRAVFGLNC